MTGTPTPRAFEPRLEPRVMYQRRRSTPARANNSLRRTYDLLRSSLHHTLEPGCMLVEADLVQNLSSSRNTVRTALQLLAREGLVTRGPKVGTTVRGSTLLPLNDVLNGKDKAAYRMHHEGVETSIIPAPELVRGWLRLPEGSSVAVIEGLVYQESTPVGLSVSYVGLTPAQEAKVGNAMSDVIHFLEHCLEVSIGECETTVAALAADEETAELLHIAEGAPMLWFEDFVRDADGTPRAICQLRYRGDRVAFGAIARRPEVAQSS